MSVAECGIDTQRGHLGRARLGLRKKQLDSCAVMVGPFEHRHFARGECDLLDSHRLPEGVRVPLAHREIGRPQGCFGKERRAVQVTPSAHIQNPAGQSGLVPFTEHRRACESLRGVIGLDNPPIAKWTRPVVGLGDRGSGAHAHGGTVYRSAEEPGNASRRWFEVVRPAPLMHSGVGRVEAHAVAQPHLAGDGLGLRSGSANRSQGDREKHGDHADRNQDLDQCEREVGTARTVSRST